jgi:hypothetical protein
MYTCGGPAVNRVKYVYHGSPPHMPALIMYRPGTQPLTRKGANAMSTAPKNMQLIIQGTAPAGTGFTKPQDCVLNYASYNLPSAGYTSPAFRSAWAAANQAVWLAAKDFSYTLVQYVTYVLDSPSTPADELVVGANGTFNATPGAPMPSANAAFIFLKGNGRGRSSHGGIHFGSLPAAFVTPATDPNTFNAAAITLLNAVKLFLIAPVTDSFGNIWNLSILSRKASQLSIGPPVNVVTLPVIGTGSFLDTDVATMRRRKERTSR